MFGDGIPSISRANIRFGFEITIIGNRLVPNAESITLEAEDMITAGVPDEIRKQ